MVPLLEVRDLKKHFVARKSRVVKAVDGVSFSLMDNETLAIVGESGCGKSTTASLILQILDPTEGDVFFRGKPLSRMDPPELREYRRRVQMVFQDPFASLDPMMTLNEIITEPYDIFRLYTRSERLDRSADLLERVGLDPSYGGRYPHELSGGQRQRVAIARALVTHPLIVLADEPTANLDSVTGNEVLDLMERINKERGTTFIFSSHDPGIMKRAARVIRLHDGEVQAA